MAGTVACGTSGRAGDTAGSGGCRRARCCAGGALLSSFSPNIVKVRRTRHRPRCSHLHCSSTGTGQLVIEHSTPRALTDEFLSEATRALLSGATVELYPPAGDSQFGTSRMFGVFRNLPFDKSQVQPGRACASFLGLASAYSLFECRYQSGSSSTPPPPPPSPVNFPSLPRACSRTRDRRCRKPNARMCWGWAYGAPRMAHSLFCAVCGGRTEADCERRDHVDGRREVCHQAGHEGPQP